jgi:hypothetical protein
MDRPILRHNERKNDADGGGFDDGTESLVEVNARLLCETTNNPACLVTSKRSIGIEFVMKNPFATYDVSTGRGGARVQVWFWRRASYSSCMAWCQEGSQRATR